jgi:hypothetical protein
VKKHLVSFAVLAAAFVTVPALARPQGEPQPPLPGDQKPQPCSKTNNVQPCTPDGADQSAAGTQEPKKDEPKADEPKKDEGKQDEGKKDEAAAGAGAGAAAGGSGVTLTGPSTGEPAKDQPQAEPEKKPKSKKYTFTGTSLLFDQSMTTQTAQLEAGSPQQSYVPLYEWWISFRPRFYFTEKLYTWARIDFFKEFTNSGDTTYARENVFGDIWTHLVYKTTAPWSKKTDLSATLRLDIPTSKASQANGMITRVGIGGGIRHTIDINGEDAKALNSASFGLSAQYGKPIFTSTTRTSYGGFERERQGVDGRTFVSDQISGSMLANHVLLVVASGGLHITPKLSFNPSMIWINTWKHAPKEDVTIQTATGPTLVPRNSDATLFQQQTWFLTTVDYELFDELSLGIGYYNLANIIAPNGVRRGVVGGDNIWWSPDARVFFDVTFNIDKIYDWASGKKKDDKKAAAAAAPTPQQQRIQRLANGSL